MRKLFVQLLVVSVIAIVAWWPLAEHELNGPFFATHVGIPVLIAVIALLVFRLLRSLIVSVLCGLAIAALVAFLFRHYGEQLHRLLRWVFP